MNPFGSKVANSFGNNRQGSLLFNSGTNSMSSVTTSNNANSNNDIEVPSPPDDTVQALKFNPQISGMPILLAAGSWDNTCRVWQVNESNGTVEPKLMQNIGAPILSVDWFNDGSKLFIASADKLIRVWDLSSNQLATVGQHDEPVRICHWLQTSQYSCLMTGSWDRTLRFWDMRQIPQQNALSTIQLGERVYCSDVFLPVGVIALANKHIKLFSFDSQPHEVGDTESPLKFQSRCIRVFTNKLKQPNGYALGSIEGLLLINFYFHFFLGRVAIQYLNPVNTKDNFTFKCHRSGEIDRNHQEIYSVNDIIFHPQHNTLATVGSDRRYCFWDKDSRSKLKNSEAMQLPITKCDINPGGQVFAYAVGYDWSQGHEGNVILNGTKIFLHGCSVEMKPKEKK